MTETPQFITPTQAAGQIGVSHSTVLKWCRTGTLRAFKTPGVKGRFLIAPTDLDAFIDAQMTRTP